MEVRIHQIYFDPKQLATLDPAFLPLDNTSNEAPEWREYHVFRNAYLRGLCDRGVTGFFSWKFRRKTGVLGSEFIRFIEANPGHEVYFISPRLGWKNFPNIWLHGEHYHPGIISLAEELFQGVGRPLDLRALRHAPQATLFCNFWAGTAKF
jgi:hypothetical protein